MCCSPRSHKELDTTEQLNYIPLKVYSDGNESRVAQTVKNPPAGGLGSILGLGRSPGEGHGTPRQYSYLEKSMDRGAWWATVHGVKKNWTRLSMPLTKACPVAINFSSCILHKAVSLWKSGAIFHSHLQPCYQTLGLI